MHVRDVPQLAGYFRDVLGFRWDFGGEDYAVVWRDNSAVHFVKALIDPSGVHLFQWIRDVDAYYAEVRARGATVIVEPAEYPLWLTRVFGLCSEWSYHRVRAGHRLASATRSCANATRTCRGWLRTSRFV